MSGGVTDGSNACGCQAPQRSGGRKQGFSGRGDFPCGKAVSGTGEKDGLSGWHGAGKSGASDKGSTGRSGKGRGADWSGQDAADLQTDAGILQKAGLLCLPEGENCGLFKRTQGI